MATQPTNNESAQFEIIIIINIIIIIVVVVMISIIEACLNHVWTKETPKQLETF